jgi:hypothetical protein
MTQQTKNAHPKTQPKNGSSLDEVNIQKKRADGKEVVGGYKNDGLKDHKGAH